MSQEYRPGLGKAIIAGIIKDGLVTAVCENLCSWSAHADETIEAIVHDWEKNAEQCENCENWALLGSHDSDGVFVCHECDDGLEPEGEEA